MKITVRAQAKINWSLDVCAGRDDGYHELDMLMQRIDLSDTLTFERARFLTLTVGGRTLSEGGRDLVLQAAQALNDHMGRHYGARITLAKHIPIRAGLGGGSADCAATLIALDRLWGLRLPMQELLKIGRKLGADVPYCIAQVFSEYDRVGGTLGLDNAALAQAILARDLDGMDRLCGNALEAPSISLMPEIGAALRALRAAGARVARMSGSGSAVFGVFRTAAEALRAAEALPGALFTWTC